MTSKWLTQLLKFFLLWVFFFPTAKEDLLITTLATAGQCYDSLLFPMTASLSSSSSIVTAPLTEFSLRNQNNGWAQGLTSHEKESWTGAETQLLGLPQTWPFLSVSWVISSGPFLSNWDENLLFYLSLSAPLVSKVYLILLDSSLVLKGKIKLSSWSLPKASNHSAWQEAVVKPFSLLLLEVSLSINNYPPFAERAMWTPSQTSILKSSPLWNIDICKNHQSIVLTKWKQVSVNHIWMYSSNSTH